MKIGRVEGKKGPCSELEPKTGTSVGDGPLAETKTPRIPSGGNGKSQK